MCSRVFSTAICCSRLISFTSISHSTDPTLPWLIRSSGFWLPKNGIVTPEDWFSCPTFSSTVIFFSSSSAFRCASSCDTVCAATPPAKITKAQQGIRNVLQRKLHILPGPLFFQLRQFFFRENRRSAYPTGLQSVRPLISGGVPAPVKRTTAAFRHKKSAPR
jgi:hypothetical protein